jgi:hypothetical protein
MFGLHIMEGNNPHDPVNLVKKGFLSSPRICERGLFD